MKRLSAILINLVKRRWVRIIAVLVGLFALLDLRFPPKTGVAYSAIVTADDGSVLHAFLNRQDKWRIYAELPDITPTLRRAILFKEDRYFYYHPGFNPVAMLRALGRNMLTGRRTSGASTITMQVARLLEPRNRTYGSKVVELLRAVQLELHYSKAEILQLYLNLIPYGSNVEGLKSASLLYFGKSPTLLSLAEITTLAIIPNRPSSLRLGQNNAYIRQERNRWLRRFATKALFPAAAIADAIAEPLTARRREAPQQVPHLSLRLRREQQGASVIHSTIRPVVQATAEQLVQNYVNRVRAVGIQNAAVLVANNQTGAVEAYVGSADFQNTVDGGQVDGIRAVRSPGSALKPLLYGLAFDAGSITPKTKLNDVPTNFSGYEPENYDRRFNGPVTAEFALANSLNVPAVKLLKAVSTPTLVTTLKKAGFSTVQKQSKELGLSMILGGCGVTLEEMTRLYVALASEGAIKPLFFTEPAHPERSLHASTEPAVQLISPEAAYLVTNTLAQITRPDLPNNFDNSYHLPRIAWKTGTSYGRRDAWSIGYNRHYTIGVWVGNFSGTGVPELSGANTATPLLFQLFNALDYNSGSGWFRAPVGRLSKRPVCPESGDVPGDYCENRTVDYVIEGVSRTQPCQHKKAVFTDPAGTISYCAHCLPAQGFVTNRYPNLAPELIAYYQAKRLPYAAIPPHNPACERVFTALTAQNELTITSPNDGSTYFLDVQQGTQMQLGCQTANDVRAVFWYLNDKLYRKAVPTEAVFFTPRPGRLKISCADDKGRHVDSIVLIRAE